MQTLNSPQRHFATLPDPRRITRNKLHALEDIVMITLCATLCGQEDWVGIEDFAHEHEAWLRTFLALPNGIPSHDTLSDVMGRIDKTAFSQAFAAWVQEALPSLVGHQIALDGKTLRGSARGAQSSVHLMTAFATQARLVLGVQEVDKKHNEIHAIPDILAQLELKGAIVTIDAMGCQKSVAKILTDNKADYVLALKENHPNLYEDISVWLDDCDSQGYVRQTENVEKDHGRLETRRVAVSTDLAWLAQRTQWAGLKAVAMVESSRHIKGKTSVERRYYLSSISDPKKIAQAIREHWRIENQQHWVLDVQFGEDDNQTSAKHAASNLGVIRRMALNMMRVNDESTLSMRRRKMRALSNVGYREQLLFGNRSPAA